MKYIVTVLSLVLTFSLISCESKPEKEGEVQADSLKTANENIAVFETDSPKVADVVVPEVGGKDSVPAVKVQGAETSQAGWQFTPEATLAQKFDQLSEITFEDRYEVNAMAEQDKTPFFPKARHKLYRRMRIKKPIGNSAGKRVYPRHTLKAFEFGSEKELVKTLEEWLNSHESSAEKIELGQHVEALKSPPVLVAVSEKQVFMLQTTCMYASDDFDQVRAGFMKLQNLPEITYVFSIGCNAGEVTYQKGGK